MYQRKLLTQMTLLTVSRRCREKEICGFKWEWAVPIPIPGLEMATFLIPGHWTEDRENQPVS
jgi:hypothetical protein